MGYECICVHNTELSSPTSPLPDSWNSSSSCFSFQYKSGETQFGLRILPFDDTVIIHFSKQGSNSSKQFQRNLCDYFSRDHSLEESSSHTEAWKLLGDEFLEFLNGSEDNTEKKTPQKLESYHNSPLMEPNDPHAERRGHPQYPFAPRYEGHHPGMEVGPDNPIFGDDPLRISQPRRPGYPNRGPPGARFDPYGPFPGPNAGPNPDHMGFPPDVCLCNTV